MTAPPGGAQARPDSSMTLLREVMERPLDPGYEDAARRRAAGAPSPRGWRRVVGSVLVLVLATAIGLGGVWAARELRATPPGATARTVLTERIRERAADGEELLSDITVLQAEIQALQQQAFGDAAAEAIEEGRDLGVWAGTTPVSGPGVVVEMADSERAQAGEPGSADERVTDFDLQVVVNGLWAAGAESVAVNGIRLTAASAVRSAGDAVLVDLRPVASPYTIEAVGAPGDLRTAFARTTGAAHLAALSAGYGITSSLEEVEQLTLPAGAAPPLTILGEEP